MGAKRIGGRFSANEVGADLKYQIWRDLEAGLAKLVEPGVTVGALWDIDHAHVLGRAVAVDRLPLVPKRKRF